MLRTFYLQQLIVYLRCSYPTSKCYC